MEVEKVHNINFKQNCIPFHVPKVYLKSLTNDFKYCLK
jgi:hypothetical protein